MSDKPLFENMDEQEAQYAPEQLPPGSTEANRSGFEEATTGDVSDEEQPAEGALAAELAAGVGIDNAASGAIAPTGAGGLPAATALVAGEALEENTRVDDAAEEEGSR